MDLVLGLILVSASLSLQYEYRACTYFVCIVYMSDYIIVSFDDESEDNQQYPFIHCYFLYIVTTSSTRHLYDGFSLLIPLCV